MIWFFFGKSSWGHHHIKYELFFLFSGFSTIVEEWECQSVFLFILFLWPLNLSLQMELYIYDLHCAQGSEDLSQYNNLRRCL